MSRHIVVFEDEPALLELLKTVLVSEGFRVTGVSSPHPEIYGQLGTVDLFLVDLMLPSRNGLEVAAWLASHGYRDTPMICMSGYRDSAREAGQLPVFDGVVLKPFDLEELTRTIRQHLVIPASERSA